MASTRKTAAKKGSRGKSAPGRQAEGRLAARAIRVRMYRVGFGDCFLVSLPLAKGADAADRHRHILVDCGVHARGDINTMADVIEDIAAVTGGRLAAVVATHSHQDHISGFAKFAEKFSGFEIAEVWLPWSEDPRDPLAVKLQRKHAALAESLDGHFRAQLAAGRAAAHTPQRAAAAEAVANLVGNKKAMQMLRSGFGVGAEVRYLEAGDALKGPADTPGLYVQVLGPPRDKKFLARMDPPEDQRYLRLGAGGAVVAANELRPFAPKWVLDRASGLHPHLTLSAEEERDLRDGLADDALDGLAFALDQAKNNTSLVTLLVFRGQYLLFPGDAQYGNWKWWLDNEGGEEILPRINFLKVAHHGSHNATPKDALEKMADGSFAAMVSTQSVPWDSIPRVPLMRRLSEKAKNRLVRSDWLKIRGAPGPLHDTAPPKPARLPDGFREGRFWYDYLIAVD
jgi:hypothetical protein